MVGAHSMVRVAQADLRDPATVLSTPEVGGTLDFDAPVAVLAVASLHYVAPQADLPAVVAGYRDALAAGSALVISHGSDDVDDPVAAGHMRVLASVMATSATPAYLRSRAELREAVAGFTLADPGLVDIRRRRTTSELPDTAVYGAVGIKGHDP